jgi:signal transduction histidine kinase
VAHDVNNLLSIVTVCIELALDQGEPDDPRAELMTEALRASARAGELAKQLTGTMRSHRAPPTTIDVNAAIAAAVPALQRLAGDHVEIVLQLATDIAPVMIGASELERVLANLVVNARDAMANGGTVRIGTRLVDVEILRARRVVVTIADTGSGMDDATCHRAFEPFFTTKPPGRGTGLGLAIVKEIVEGAGGIIQVHTKLESGTSIELSFAEAGTS